MEKEKIKGLLPDGSYDEIAGKLGISYGTVSQYFSGQEVRISAQTELLILEQAEKIVEEKISAFIKERRANAKSRMAA